MRRFRDGVGATQGVKLTMEACCIMFSVKPEMEKNPDGAVLCPLLVSDRVVVSSRRWRPGGLHAVAGKGLSEELRHPTYWLIAHRCARRTRAR